MGARLIVLIVVGAALAVYYGTRTPAAPGAHVKIQEFELGQIEPNQMLWHYDLPGEQPAEPPDLELTLSIDSADGKNRIYYTISEANDYYVESFVLEFWYLTDPDTEFDESPIQIEQPVDLYVKAGEVLEYCTDVVPAELEQVTGEMGTIDNWAGRITGRGGTRYRSANPPELRREELHGCN